MWCSSRFYLKAWLNWEKFAARKQEMFLLWSQKHFCLPDTNFASETYVSQFSHPGNITRNIVSATMFPSLTRPLGPLLFLLYINDLCNVSQVLDFILFADDTNIFFSHKDKDILEKTMNDELLKLTGWCLANKLSINYSTSKFMIFKPRQRNLDCDVRFEINNCPIERVKETIFLGVVLDKHLNWKAHISNVSREIAKSIGIIFKSRFCLSLSPLRTLYYSLVYPYLMYFVSVWA